MLNIPALEQQIRDGMAAAFVPGLAIAVIHDNDLIYQNGFGITSVEDPHPVTPETLFRIGSITKPLTATMMMRLVEQNSVFLDKPVWEYSRRLFGEAGQEISLRMLLSHTAGVPNDLSYYPSQRGKRQETASRQTLFSPGTAYQYSNPGINIVRAIVEEVVPHSYTDLMQREVFTPLNMTRSTFDPLIAMTYPLAQPHLIHDDDSLYVMRPFIDNPPMYPCGFAISNVLELANFARMHLNEGRFNDETYLSPESIQEMHTPVVDRMTAEDTGYGLCFRSYRYKGIRLVGHNGAIGKYGGWLWMHKPTRTAVIMLVNRAPQFWGYGANIINAILDEVLDFHPALVPEIPSIPADTAEWQKFTGSYIGWDSGLVQLTEINHRPHVSRNFGEPVALDAIRPHVYASENRQISIGLLADNYIYYNGNLCSRLLPYSVRPHTFAPDTGTINPDFAGVYRHDIDTFTVRIADNTLYIHAMDDRAEYRCIKLNTGGNNHFVSAIGLVQFNKSGSELILSNAFNFQKV